MTIARNEKHCRTNQPVFCSIPYRYELTFSNILEENHHSFIIYFSKYIPYSTKIPTEFDYSEIEQTPFTHSINLKIQNFIKHSPFQKLNLKPLNQAIASSLPLPTPKNSTSQHIKTLEIKITLHLGRKLCHNRNLNHFDHIVHAI